MGSREYLPDLIRSDTLAISQLSAGQCISNLTMITNTIACTTSPTSVGLPCLVTVGRPSLLKRKLEPQKAQTEANKMKIMAMMAAMIHLSILDTPVALSQGFSTTTTSEGL